MSRKHRNKRARKLRTLRTLEQLAEVKPEYFHSQHERLKQELGNGETENRDAGTIYETARVAEEQRKEADRERLKAIKKRNFKGGPPNSKKLA